MIQLYLSAISKEKIGYTPGWIKLGFADGSSITLTTDGKHQYNKDTLDCVMQGGCSPWSAVDVNGKEQNFKGMSEDAKDDLYPGWKIVKLFEDAKSFTIYLWPEYDDSKPFTYKEFLKRAAKDELRECKGKVELFEADFKDKLLEREFAFNVEIIIENYENRVKMI